ncbi:epoxyalkane--coenzyme M transferase [Candidatus Entotheonella serta]|nr:epoxyalkane--coenzyme M transferase [Candidatus Entotheonella serta]
MKQSTDRILTTHVGSLPRPTDLIPLLQAKNNGDAYDPDQLEELLTHAVEKMVEQQIAHGIDVVSDGEMSKLSYTTYILLAVYQAWPTRTMSRLWVAPHQHGTNGKRGVTRQSDMAAHPDYVAQIQARERQIVGDIRFPKCVCALHYENMEPLEQDLARFRGIVNQLHPTGAFLPAASPGVLSTFIANQHYATNEAYLAGLADAMQTEYEAIADAGFVLQIDCPDLAASNHTVYQHLSEHAWLKVMETHVEVLNHAVRNIPAEKMRMHICWGNYEGPHTHDVAWFKVAPVVFKAKPQAILFEAANPRARTRIRRFYLCDDSGRQNFSTWRTGHDHELC